MGSILRRLIKCLPIADNADTSFLLDRLTRLSKNSLLEKSSQKSPTTGSKIAKMLFGTQKTRRFSMFLSHFPKINFREGTFSTVSTECVTGAGEGVDSAWEQGKLEARKMPENAADSPASSAPRKSGGSFFTPETVQRMGKVYSQ